MRALLSIAAILIATSALGAVMHVPPGSCAFTVWHWCPFESLLGSLMLTLAIGVPIALLRFAAGGRGLVAPKQPEPRAEVDPEIIEWRAEIDRAWRMYFSDTAHWQASLAEKITLFSAQVLDSLWMTHPRICVIAEDARLKFILHTIFSTRLHSEDEMNKAIEMLEYMSTHPPPAVTR
jgi:hypothetical protein